jgi:hypothetical protein
MRRPRGARAFDRSKEWALAGARTPGAWLQHECRMSGRDANTAVSVARQVDEMRAVADAWQSGAIGTGHAFVSTAAVDATSPVLDQGRTVRSFTPAQRRAITVRYPTCAFPGCTIPAPICRMHHLDWWDHGGRTDLGNGIPLCRHHHHFPHELGWHLERDRATGIVTWHRPDSTHAGETHPAPSHHRFLGTCAVRCERVGWLLLFPVILVVGVAVVAFVSVSMSTLCLTDAGVELRNFPQEQRVIPLHEAQRFVETERVGWIAHVRPPTAALVLTDGTRVPVRKLRDCSGAFGVDALNERLAALRTR